MNEGFNKKDELTAEEFDKWSKGHVHWINEDEIEKYGLVPKEEEDGEEPYHCRDNGECLGHTTYINPKFGGNFHLGDDCKVQNLE